MTETAAPPLSVCRFPGCDDPVYREGICRDHHEQFNGPDTAAPPQDARPASVAPAASGRLRISPLHAVVRSLPGGSAVLGVYGVYGTEELAGNAARMLSGLGIPDEMQVVPFYEVTP